MTSTPVVVGTLIVVILKAKNLPNKRHIGKQDPYCLVKLNNENRRTKAVKRGGQHPEWDEEVRFTILEDVEDELARTAGGDGLDDLPPPLPPKKEYEKKKKKIKGPKQMQLMCYADDPREPALIGETMVDLTEVLTKGETDEWFTLTNKEKYCGEVYLELTFWSNEKPPEKRTTPPSSAFHPQYGGPGSFTPSAEIPSSLKHGGSSHNTPSPSRLPSSSGPDTSVPPSLRPSGSLAQISLYTAPYEKRSRSSDVDVLSNELSDLGVSSPTRRRESFPPNTTGPSEFGYTGGNARQNGSYSTMSSSASVSSVHSIGPPVSGSRPPRARPSLSSLPEPFVQEEYFPGLPHTMQPVSESYPPYPYQSPSGFVQPPPVSQTPGPIPPQLTFPSPAPIGFHSPQPQQYPPPSQTPIQQYSPYSQPPVSAPPLQYVPEGVPLPPPSVSPNSHPASQQYPPSPPHQAPPPPPPSAYQQQYGHQATPSPPQQHQQPPHTPIAYQQYGQHASPSPPQQQQQPPPPGAYQQYGQHASPSPPHQHQLPSFPNAYQQMQPNVPPPQGSRPLPNPQVQQYHSRRESLSASGLTSPPPGTPPSMSPGNMTLSNAMPFQPPGPPPPPPSRRRTSPPLASANAPSVAYPLAPPPPPPLQNGMYQSHASHLNTPPPPPPSLYQSNSSPSQPYYGQQSQQPYPSQQSQPPYPPQQSQPPYPPQQSQPPYPAQQSHPPQQPPRSYTPQQSLGYGWAPPPPPPSLPSVSGISSPPHPSSFSTPPPQQPYYLNEPSGAPGWNTPPRQNPPQKVYESQDGWRQ